jgi:hypothetical protein
MRFGGSPACLTPPSILKTQNPLTESLYLCTDITLHLDGYLMTANTIKW